MLAMQSLLASVVHGGVRLLQIPDLGGLGLGDAGANAVLDVGDLQPAVQAGLRDAEVPGDLGQRSLLAAGHGNDVAAELRGERCRHGDRPSREVHPHRSGVNQTLGSPNPRV